MLRFTKTLLLAGSLVLSSSIASFGADYVSIAKDGVNIRTGPSTDNPIYMELFKGYPLMIIEKKGDWFKVQDFEKDSGWVYSTLVSSEKNVIVSATGKANMRSGPSTNNAIVASIERGVVLTLLDRKAKWVEVQHLSGTKGWIYAPLVWP